MAAPMRKFLRPLSWNIFTRKCNFYQVTTSLIDTCALHTSTAINRKNSQKSIRRLENFLTKRKVLLKQTDQLAVIKPPQAMNPGIKGRHIPPHASIRLKTYNTIVFENLKDVFSTNVISEELQELQVEIVAVRYTGDLSTCKVFWKATGTHEENSRIQTLLNNYAPKIRHYLISHRILSKIPQLCFLVDRAAAREAEVIKLLSIADLGPPEENTEESQSLPEYEEEKDEKLVEEIESDDDMVDDIGSDSDCQENLFGIDHTALQMEVQMQKQKQMEADAARLGVVKKDSNADDLEKNFQQFYKDIKKRKSKKAMSTIRKEGRMYRGELDEMNADERMEQDEWEDSWDFGRNDFDDYEEKQ